MANIKGGSTVNGLPILAKSGSNNYVPKFDNNNVLSNSQIYDNGTGIGIGVTNPVEKLEVSGNVKAASFIGNVNATNSSSGTTANNLIIRDANGRAQVNDPSASADIMTKNYGDTNYFKPSNGGNILGDTSFSQKVYINKFGTQNNSSLLISSSNNADYLSDSNAGDTILRSENNNKLLFGFKGAAGAEPSVLKLSYLSGGGSVQTPKVTLDDGSGNISTTGTITAGTINGSVNATNSSSASSTNTLMLRDSNGRAQVANPATNSDIATKDYIDHLSISGLYEKQPVQAASIGANITLGGVQNIDGVTLSTGDRVLVKDQTNASENGIYIVDSGAWTRTQDFNGSTTVVKSGAAVRVINGNVNANTVWQLTTADPITVGTTSLSFNFAGGNMTTTATLIVGASNSKNISQTDFQCSGVSDQNIINAAISALPSFGGKIVLLEGTFIVDGSILIPSNVTLEGQGKSTIIKIKSGLNVSSSAIKNADTSGGNKNIVVTNLVVDANNSQNTAGIQYGINFTLVSYSTISFSQVLNARNAGIVLSNCSNNVITSNLVKGNTQQGVYCWGGNSNSRNTIVDNVFENNSPAISIDGNSSGDNYAMISNNQCNANVSGITIDNGSNHNTVIGNMCIGGSGTGISVASSNNTISGNTCKGNTDDGISVVNCNNVVVSGNLCKDNGKAGILLNGGGDSTVSGNMCMQNSQTTNAADDNIRINTSSTNNVQNNTCRQGSVTNKPRYGLNVSVGSNNNTVSNNDLTSGGATGNYNNQGTGTIGDKAPLDSPALIGVPTAPTPATTDNTTKISTTAFVNNLLESTKPGIAWTTRPNITANQWYSVCYGNGLFVAVAYSGTGNRVATSPDGVNWTIRTSAADNGWFSVCYGNGLFVAVASTGIGNRVMTSPDGINWTLRSSAADNNWYSVCYGNGLFVAVAASGTGNRVMTSLDGINWTSRSSAADNDWQQVCYGNGLFVAIASTGTGNRVMTSSDGINWTIRTSAADNNWNGITYGNGLFVAVANSGTGNRIMTSPDGINWTSRSSAADNYWRLITYGGGMFVTVATSGTGNRVMTSYDGINWTIRSCVDSSWYGICYGNGLFVSVAYGGTPNIMTSGSLITSPDASKAPLYSPAFIGTPAAPTPTVSDNSNTLATTAYVVGQNYIKQPGINWSTRTSAADNQWVTVCYGNGLFVAVGQAGIGNRVMTSPDGITWTIRTSAADNGWTSVCYGNGLFVAVAYTGTGNRVMTSTDGITWTIRTSPADNSWYSVCYGNGLFVAVAQAGTTNRVMTSPDGITWTLRASATSSSWYSVCYGNGLFVAVSTNGTGNRVMTSPDGITWTTRTSAADNNWVAVCYGNGLFVAVGQSGAGNRVMTSPDGITWTIATTPVDNSWSSVCYGDGLFVAVSNSGTDNRVMTSPDGINWTIRTNSINNNWYSVCYGNGLFVAVAAIGTAGNKVMTSGTLFDNSLQYIKNYVDQQIALAKTYQP